MPTCPSCRKPIPANPDTCPHCGSALIQEKAPDTTLVRQLRVFVIVALTVMAILFTSGRTGEGEAVTTSTTSSSVPTTTQPIENLIPLFTIECSYPGLNGFGCDNLGRTDETEYQLNWIGRTDDTNVTIRLTFFEPMVVSRILWRNISDPVRFRQNYRAQGLLISSQDGSIVQPISLKDDPGLQQIQYGSDGTSWIEIEVVNAYLAQVVEENVYGELAITSIEVLGWRSG